MRRSVPAAALLLLAGPLAWSLAADAPPARPQAPGLGEPGKLTAIAVETGRAKDGLVTISGRDSGQQIVVTGQYDSGQTRDLTRNCTYEVSPAGIVSVDASGLITPVAEGEATGFGRDGHQGLRGNRSAVSR